MMCKTFAFIFFLLFYLRSKRQYYQKISFFATNHRSQNGKFLWLDKTTVSYYFASLMALKSTRSFYALIRHLFLVIQPSILLQNPKQQVSIIFWFFSLVSDFKTNTASFCTLIRHLFLFSYASFMAMKFKMGIF